MADTDIIGIVSLLLAAGGAAYLIRHRRMEVAQVEAEEEVEAAGSSPSIDAPEDDEPDTIPPNALLPPVAPRPVAQEVVSTRRPVVRPPGPAEVPKAAPSTRKPLVMDDVPILTVEEDEDVEPTRFGNKATRGIQPPVNKIVFDEGADVVPTSKPTKRLVVHSYAQTDPGRRRKQNEDSFLVLDEHAVFVVADGMGGHRGGLRASRLAVETVRAAFEAQSFEATAHDEIPGAASELARAIQMSNTAILEEAAEKVELKGMGTTICAVRFAAENRRLYIAHIGDSRCYRLRDGVMKQITTDHTMADYGIAGPEAAQLSRALGIWPSIPIDLIMASPMHGDLYLLCSDGLTRMLPDETIRTQLLHEEDPKAAVGRLIMFANAHGGKDNITAVLLRIVEPGWKPPAP